MDRRRAAEPGKLRDSPRRLDCDARLGEPEPHRPGSGLDLDERAVGADRGDFVAGARRRPVERRHPAKRRSLSTEKQERSLLVPVREPGGHRPNQLGVGREEEGAEPRTRRLRHPRLHHYRIGAGRHEPLGAAHEGVLQHGGLPAPQRLDTPLALEMPGEPHVMGFGGLDLEDVHEERRPCHQRAGYASRPAAAPRPALARVERRAPGVLAAGVLSVPERGVVGERGAIPGEQRHHVRAGPLVGEPGHPARVDGEVQAVGVPVPADGGAALEARVAFARAEDGEPLVGEQHALRTPFGRGLERRPHGGERPPGEIAPGPARRRGPPRVVQPRVVVLSGRSREGVERGEPGVQLLVGPEPRPPDLPELEVGRLRERHAVARVAPRREGEVGERRAGRREERRTEMEPDLGVVEQIEPRRPRPVHPLHQAAQREEVIILALPPEPVLAEAVGEETEQPGARFHRRARQLLVAEPRGDGGERRGVPGLPVGEPLVEVADERRRLVGEVIHALGALLGKEPRLLEQERRREVRRQPERLEVGGEEEVRRAQHVVAIRKGRVQLLVRLEQVERPGGEAGVVALVHRRQQRQIRRALGEPEVLRPGPVAVMALPGKLLAAPAAGVALGAPGVEAERGAVVGADAAVPGEQRLDPRHRRRLLENPRDPLPEHAEQAGPVRVAGDGGAERLQLLRRQHAGLWPGRRVAAVLSMG